MHMQNYHDNRDNNQHYRDRISVITQPYITVPAKQKPIVIYFAYTRVF